MLVLCFADMRRSQELQNGRVRQNDEEDPLFYPDVEPSPRLNLSLRPYQARHHNGVQLTIIWFQTWPDAHEFAFLLQREGLRWLVARESSGSVGGPGQQGSFNLPLPPGWTEHTTESGKRYFVNDETKQSYWTFPYDAWASHYDRQKKRLPVSVCGGILADDMGTPPILTIEPCLM